MFMEAKPNKSVLRRGLKWFALWRKATALALAVLVLLGILLIAAIAAILAPDYPEGACDPSVTSGASAQTNVRVGDLNQDQMNNAATIVATGQKLNIPERGLIISLMTAMQESTMKNLDHGDRDSVGLFQQRNAWGSFKERTDPATSAAMFFTGGRQGQPGLLDTKGWEKMGLGEAAQAVQVSAFPYAYNKWEGLARDIVDRLTEIGAIKPNNPFDEKSLGDGFLTDFDEEGDANPEIEPGLCLVASAKFGTGGQLSWPVPPSTRQSSPFGRRFHPVLHTWRLHAGVDLAVGLRTPVHSAAPGTVRFSGWASGYGNYICINHEPPMSTCYGHLMENMVKKGDRVTQGQQIAKSGNTGGISTGPHLHFEVRMNGNPVDPMPYLTANKLTSPQPGGPRATPQ
jgi:murein DD-endopeptidase MepM/ murein hydrolase activator NlpD